MFDCTFKIILFKNYVSNILYIVIPAWHASRPKWVKVFRGKVVMESLKTVVWEGFFIIVG